LRTPSNTLASSTTPVTTSWSFSTARRLSGSPNSKRTRTCCPTTLTPTFARADSYGGACGFCASFFEVDRAIEKVEITIDGDAAEHGPDVGQLAEQGYQLLTIG
jgi:hypothetical protein